MVQSTSSKRSNLTFFQLLALAKHWTYARYAESIGNKFFKQAQLAFCHLSLLDSSSAKHIHDYHTDVGVHAIIFDEWTQTMFDELTELILLMLPYLWWYWPHMSSKRLPIILSSTQTHGVVSEIVQHVKLDFCEEICLLVVYNSSWILHPESLEDKLVSKDFKVSWASKPVSQRERLYNIYPRLSVI